MRKWVGKIWTSVVLVLEEFEDLHHEAVSLLHEVDFCVGWVAVPSVCRLDSTHSIPKIDNKQGLLSICGMLCVWCM